MSRFLAIPIDDSDTEGHAAEYEFTPEDGDEWVDQMLRRDPERAPVRIRLADDDDTEGHLSGRRTLRLVVQGDDDTEGHEISVHFPSADEADRFRRRLLATGMLVGAVALGATTGALLSDRSQAGAPDVGTVAAERVSGEYAHDRGIGTSPRAADEGESLEGNPNKEIMPR
jgi:hypothetical protein